MRSFLAALLWLATEGCAAPNGVAYEASATACDVGDLSVVFEDPLRYSGKMFCGVVLAYPEGLVIKMFPPSHGTESRNDIVLLAEAESEELLRRGAVDRPFHVHVEGVLEPMAECFEVARPQGHICTPYRRPILIRLRSARRIP